MGIVSPERDSLSGRFPVLEGRRVIVAGFDAETTAAMSGSFDAVGAFCRATPDDSVRAALRSCDLGVVGLDLAASVSLDPERTSAALIVAVPREASIQPLRWLERTSVDYVFHPGPEEELLTRAAVALWRRKPSAREEHVRVLLADDDPSITALLKATMESAGMVCRCTRDGVESLQAIREWGPEVAVLDINMPGMDGYQILSALQQEPPAGNLKIMLLTGCDQEAEVLKGFKLGAGDYVIKPFNPLEVLARVKRMVAETA